LGIFSIKMAITILYHRIQIQLVGIIMGTKSEQLTHTKMSKIKLYPEEQVKEFIKEHYFLMERDLDNLKPIELPSDEEIEQQASGVYSDPIRWAPGEKYVRSSIYTDGAKWVIEQIKKQAK